MQRLQWYVRRLRSMSAPELLHRVHALARSAGDRARLAMGHVPRPGDLEAAIQAIPKFRPVDAATNLRREAGGDEAGWLSDLVTRADAAVARRLSFFDLRDKHLGNPIDWNRDHAADKAAPRGFAGGIDYRDFSVTGDCKLVWEPNRHQHLVVLGRAYRTSGDARYARAVADQLASWLDQCPFGYGMNWRSPLELAIRLINWVFALSLIEGSGAVVGDLRSRVWHSAWLHMWDIARKFSHGSSANNHLVGEASGLLIGASYFSGFAESPGWREAALAILEREIAAQNHADGGNKEQAFAYHLFVAEFFLLAGLAGRAAGQAPSEAYWRSLQAMLEFAGALCEGGGEPPSFGDADDGYVLDLGDARQASGLLCTGAVLFGRSDFKRWAGAFRQSTIWLLGDDARRHWSEVPDESPPALASRAFPDTGLYLLQCGTPEGSDRISVLFDCGEIGFGPIAAHGHADALSMTLRAFGVDVFVDPGTFDYFSHPKWRAYFRGTAAHNTVGVDDTDQSEMLGPFLWGQRAHARCLRYQPEVGGGEVAGEHDGYQSRLDDPVSHRRTVRLDAATRAVTVVDEMHTDGWHRVAIRFHLAPHCHVALRDRNRMEIQVAELGVVVLEMDSRLELSTLEGEESPIGGWTSRGYHQKTPSITVVGRADIAGDTAFVCRAEVLPPGVGSVRRA